jgi:hypothetical protein
MNEGPEGLRQERRKSPAQQGPLLDQPASLPGGHVHRDQGIDAEQQLGALLQCDRGVHRLEQDPIHTEMAFDLHRGIQAGDGGARLDGRRDRDMLPAPGPEHDWLARLQVCGDHEELVPQLPEVVGPAPEPEAPFQVPADRLIVEEAQRQRPAQPSERLENGRWSPGEFKGQISQDPGELQGAANPFPVGGEKETARIERGFAGQGSDESADQLRRRQAVGQ